VCNTSDLPVIVSRLRAWNKWSRVQMRACVYTCGWTEELWRMMKVTHTTRCNNYYNYYVLLANTPTATRYCLVDIASCMYVRTSTK
jgi:hypothetical protein